MNRKKAILRILNKAVTLFHLRNHVLLEIEPGRGDSTEYVYYEMLRQNWNHRFRIDILTEQPDKAAGWKAKHVRILPRPGSGKEYLNRFRLFLAKLRAKLIVDVNIQISKLVPETVHVYLTHGSPMKSVKKFYSASADTDYMLNQAEYWKPINSDEFSVPQEKLVTLGYPRNDALFSGKADMQRMFGRAYRKIVVWYPTFRHHKNAAYREGISIPVIHDPDAARSVNEYAKQYDILLVVKPHPAQELSTIRDMKLSNILFINDDLFLQHGLFPYEFLGKADALITDYSSVVFDYLITKKPIALTFEDYEQYAQHNGFAMDTDLLKSCSEMLETPDDFLRFFRDLAEGNDPHFRQRMDLMHLTNQYTDGNSSKRVVDWMETILK